MAYSDIARGQDMKQEPSDELVGLEGHGLLTVLVCIIPPSEGNFALMDVEDAVIADRNPVGISAEVLKDTLDAIERGFAIDDPLFTIERTPESFKVPGLLKMMDTVGEYKIT